MKRRINRMKKRNIVRITVLIAAIAMLTVTAFAQTTEYKGYEAFKNLLKDGNRGVKDETNLTMKGLLTLTDNDTKIFSASAVMKGDKSDKLLSGSVLLEKEDTLKEIKLYGMDETSYIVDVDNDVIYQMEKEETEKRYQRWEDNEEPQSGKHLAQEELLDFLAGDLKDDFDFVENSDGTKTIVFELTKEEMPMLLTLFVSAMDENKDPRESLMGDMDAERISKYPLLFELSHWKDLMPKIVSEQEPDYIRIALTTDSENHPIALAFDFSINGVDQDGMHHYQTISGDFKVSDIGSTQVDRINLEGKSVIVVNKDDFEQDDEECWK